MFTFQNTYIQQLPTDFYAAVLPEKAYNPALVLYNEKLAKALGIEENSNEIITSMLSGNQLPKNARPIALAYAGHQFGHFTKLGDGRALLLGEQITPTNQRYDVQLKGSGRSPYSRRGDGRATLSAMIREYLISEAMHTLHIPTTRSLAVVLTGNPVYRETIHQGAVLTRIASSHIRVGTFEYARHFLSIKNLESLINYTINRHYPQSEEAENIVLSLLQNVMMRQINLIVHWLRVGFIHGVMNTDNMSIAGETIDYGPCAFMNYYHPNTVFSSIDHQARYAFGNQKDIAFWNLCRFAETLLPFIDTNEATAVKKAMQVLDSFHSLFEEKHLHTMANKIGIESPNKEDLILINRLLNWMETNQADYTNTFITLSNGKFDHLPLYQDVVFLAWKKDWKTRIQAQNELPETIRLLMQTNNPCYIPRNHLVEEALKQIRENNDYTFFHKLSTVLSNPYNYQNPQTEFQHPPLDESQYKTYCGT